METEGNSIRDLDAEELASRARRYYATRFPNPQRLGCPPPGEIIEVVRSRQGPDEALREHLFQCSECFGEYRQALADCRPAPDEVSWAKRLFSIVASNRSAMALSSVILILSSFFIAGLIWSKFAPEAGQKTISTVSDAGAGGGGEAAWDPAADVGNAASS